MKKNNSDVYLPRGIIEFYLAEYEKIVKDFSVSVREPRPDIEDYLYPCYILGIAKEKLNDFNGALKIFYRIINISGNRILNFKIIEESYNHIEKLYNYLYGARKGYKKIHRYCNNLLKEYPNNIFADKYRDKKSFLQNYKKQIDYYTTSIINNRYYSSWNMKNEEIELYLKRSDAYKAVNKYIEAIQDLNIAIKINKYNSLPYNKKIALYKKLNLSLKIKATKEEYHRMCNEKKLLNICEKGTIEEIKTASYKYSKCEQKIYNKCLNNIFFNNNSNIKVIRYWETKFNAKLLVEDLNFLSFACENQQHLQFFKYFIEEYKIDINETNILNHALLANYNLDFIRYLVEEKHADITKINQDGKTSFSSELATKNTNLEVINYLMTKFNELNI